MQINSKRAPECSSPSCHLRRRCFGLWLKRYHLKILFLFFSSGGHFVQQSWMAWAILAVVITRNISVKLFWIQTSGSWDVVENYLELWWLFSWAEQNQMCNLFIWHYGEHSCEVILNLNMWFRTCCFKKRFTDRGTKDHAQWTKINPNSSHWAFWFMGRVYFIFITKHHSWWDNKLNISQMFLFSIAHLH